MDEVDSEWRVHEEGLRFRCGGCPRGGVADMADADAPLRELGVKHCERPCFLYKWRRRAALEVRACCGCDAMTGRQTLVAVRAQEVMHGE